MIRYLNLSLRASALCTGALLCLSVIATPQAHANQGQLDGVKQEISRQQSQVSANKKKIDALQKSLRQQEVGIAETANAIHQAQTKQANLSSSIDKLEQQQRQLQQQQLGQQELLKELLNAQYRQGKNSQIALLLSDNNHHDLDRYTIYAEHLSHARVNALDELAATTTEIQIKQHQLSTQREQQQTLLTQLQKEKKKLETEQSQRQKTVRTLTNQARTDNQYLAELKDNERRLVTEIAKAALRAKQKAAAEAARRAPMDGLAKQKGKLTWPIKGPVLHQYNSQQQGELRWKGMVIGQSAGNPVKAIYPGKVVFADWLRGYGLMLVIDHGKGDMSFYGYNQTLLKKVGDTVQASESIALVGDSGGQDRAALYFEIRRRGTPTNPQSWLKR
ncbi:peptidoglycan DD-metalloendopeptidase family protein [Photobacterium makurazakiensis]|uniref:peptidoglycan DD-metalloendopeptidase family protein n=1 Tax=Photobacterium makurazakiensis TaxID=2910234 RepID=UPI003D1338A3